MKKNMNILLEDDGTTAENGFKFMGTMSIYTSTTLVSVFTAKVASI